MRDHREPGSDQREDSVVRVTKSHKGHFTMAKMHVEGLTGHSRDTISVPTGTYPCLLGKPSKHHES